MGVADKVYSSRTVNRLIDIDILFKDQVCFKNGNIEGPVAKFYQTAENIEP